MMDMVGEEIATYKSLKERGESTGAARGSWTGRLAASPTGRGAARVWSKDMTEHVRPKAGPEIVRDRFDSAKPPLTMTERGWGYRF